MDYLVEHGHFQRLACVEGSLGAVSCATKARWPDMVGKVLLAGPSGIDLSKATFPKLFVTGDTDACCAKATKGAYNRAAEPKFYTEYATSAHAVTLFSSVYAEELVDLIVQFLKDLP